MESITVILVLAVMYIIPLKRERKIRVVGSEMTSLVSGSLLVHQVAVKTTPDYRSEMMYLWFWRDHI
jgi:multisubunit Na+/H+ antiporter MnhB subunit